ncbi:MAG: LptF/LptG family permease [Ignavibacteriae bacterium]|nr:LptF/LptG family permease [Ignavibacteriota bacterium]
MRLYIHILRAHVGPFLFSFITLMFIFLLQFLMKFIDQLVGKGLSGWVITELIVLNLAWMVVLAVPMSVFVATLMAFGNLSSNNETTAIKSSGMSLYRMMMPVALLSIVLTYLLIQFNNNVLPEANHRAKTLIIDIRRTKPTLTIEPGLFSQEISGYSILARKTFERSNDLEGVTIYDYTDPTTNTVVTAKRGRVSFTPDYKKLIMDLLDGEIHQVSSQDMQSYRRMRYNKHRIVMNAEGFDFERSGENAFSRGDRELSAQVMQHYVDSLEQLKTSAREQAMNIISEQPIFAARIPTRPTATPVPKQAVQMALHRARNLAGLIDNQMMIMNYYQKSINEYLVEIHKKYAIPVACIVFVFIGAPLGMVVRRGTFGTAATISLGFFLLYWASLIGGEKLADRGIITPWIGMWMANIVLGILGMYLTLKMARETPTIDWSRFRRFVPAPLRSLEDVNSKRESGV